MFRQLYELQQSKNRVVDGMTLMGLDPNLNRKIRNNLQDNDNDEIRGETILDHELKHAFSYTGDERAKYISLRLSQALMPNGETVIFLSKAQVDLYDDLIVADIESLIAPHHPSISDLAAAKLLAEKALASLSYDAVDNHRLLKQILDNIQNNFMSHEDASEEIFGLWARLYREEKTK